MKRYQYISLNKQVEDIDLNTVDKRLVPSYRNNGRIWYLRRRNSNFMYHLQLKWSVTGQLYYRDFFTFFYMRYFSRMRFVPNKWSEIGYMFDTAWRINFIKDRQLATYLGKKLVERTCYKFQNMRKQLRRYGNNKKNISAK